MKKAPEAFRTISEVSTILDTPAHVLRFWESKFYQIKPIKRAGGRRYYRPDDVALLAGIRHLLQGDALTIRGVQRVLQDRGVRHVMALGAESTRLALQADPDDMQTDPSMVTPDTASAPAPAGAASGPVVAARQAPPTASAAPVEDADEAPQAQAPDSPEDSPAPDPGNDARTPKTAETRPAAAGAAGAQHDGVGAETMPAPAPDAPVAGPAARPVAIQRDMFADGPDIAQRIAERIAPRLRAMPRGGLGPRRDRLGLLARRIDTLLERMSEASGAGRW